MITAGIPLASGEEGGPCINEYTPGLLRDKRIIGANPIGPTEFERKVLETAERRIVGSVTFFFERTAEADRFIEAWDKTTDAIRAHREYEAMSDADRAQVDAPPALPSIPAEVVAQVLSIHANNLKTIAGLPFVNAPICNTLTGKYTQGTAKDGKTSECSTGVPMGETKGAGKVWSTDLSNEGRANMKLNSPKIRDWRKP